MSTYADAGVDVHKAADAVSSIKEHVQSTHSDAVLRGIGAFAGALKADDIQRIPNPVLLSTIDGVGTKTIIAHMMGEWKGIGADIVHHCANDIVCQGGTPLFFLDYIASSSLEPAVIETIVKSMADACRPLGCALIGGEMAEMPQVYHDSAHDVVGCMIGYAEHDTMFQSETIKEHDVLIALPSNGLHTNGYTLARSVLLEQAGLQLDEPIENAGCTLGEALLKPHTCYSPLVRSLHKEVGLKAVAHITGGGIPGNLSRVLPKGMGADIQQDLIDVLPIFQLIQEKGAIADDSMYEAFNMGVGMIIIAAPEQQEAILKQAKGSYVIGKTLHKEGIHIQ